MELKKLSIVIPAYNEGPTIHLILEKVRLAKLEYDIDKEIIIVNDYSTDDTENAILKYKDLHRELNIQYYKHAYNQGKGAGDVRICW